MKGKRENGIIKGYKLRDLGKIKFGEILRNVENKQWKSRKRFLLRSAHLVDWVYLSPIVLFF